MGERKMKNWDFTFVKELKTVEKTICVVQTFQAYSSTLHFTATSISTFPANLPCCQVRWGQKYENKQV